MTSVPEYNFLVTYLPTGEQKGFRSPLFIPSLSNRMGELEFKGTGNEMRPQIMFFLRKQYAEELRGGALSCGSGDEWHIQRLAPTPEPQP